jgi:hypothetical protein
MQRIRVLATQKLDELPRPRKRSSSVSVGCMNDQELRRSTALCDLSLRTVSRTRQTNASSLLLNTLHAGSSLWTRLAANFELAATFTSDAKAAGTLVSVVMLSRLLVLGDSVSGRSSRDGVNHVVDVVVVGVVVVTVVVTVVIVFVGNAMSRQWRSGVDCEDMNLLDFLHGAS